MWQTYNMLAPELLACLLRRKADMLDASTNVRWINARRFGSICGRPPRERDLQRQYPRKPARCQRTRVSGRMIVRTGKIDGNNRYSWTRSQQSLLVSRTWLRTLRRKMIS